MNRRGAYHTDGGGIVRADPVTGQIIVPQQYWPLHPIEQSGTSDGFSETQFDLPAVDGAECSYRVFSGPRLCTPSRFAVACAGTGLPLTEIVRRIGTGAAWGANERWRVNAGTADEFMHNPNFGGAGPELFGHAPLTFIDAMNRQSFFSPPLHYRAIRQGGNKLRIEGAVVPLDFNTFGAEFQNVGLHTGDNETLALWHRCVQFLAIDFNWRPDIHRHTFFCYSPQDWSFIPSSCGVQPFTLSFQDYFSINAGFHDLATRQTTALDAIWSGSDNQQSLCARQFRIDQGTTNQTVGSPAPSGYPLAWMDGTGNLLFLGMWTSRQANIDDFDKCQRWNFLQLANTRDPGHPAPFYDTNSGQTFIGGSTSNQGRRAGWLGFRFYLTCRSTRQKVFDSGQSLFASRVLDEPPLSLNELPPHVLAYAARFPVYGQD